MNSSFKPRLNEMIEAPLQLLLEWRRNVAADLDFDTRTYLEGLIAYLRADRSALHAAGVDSDLRVELRAVLGMRASVLDGKVTLEDLRARLTTLSSCGDDVILGEAHFVAGYACYTIREFHQALEFYEIALRHLRAAGVFKKALKTTQNILATRTCVDPRLKCIPEYQSIYREAKRLKDHATCGLTLLNISREYQRLGALSIALETIDRAIGFYEIENGSMDYFLALAHRAHVLLQMGLGARATRDIELCLTSDFPQVHAAVRVLEKICVEPSVEVAMPLLNPTWRRRSLESSYELKSAVFTGHEAALLSYLRSGPKSRFVLIDLLYGTQIDLESAESRLKNLIRRVRKKTPDLILFENGLYKINDIDGGTRAS